MSDGTPFLRDRRQDRCARIGPDRRQKCHSAPQRRQLVLNDPDRREDTPSFEGELHVEPSHTWEGSIWEIPVETFPFPEGLSPDIPAAAYADDPRAIAIANAARRLVKLRDRWLNPPEWVEWVDEPVPGYPKRPVARDEAAAKELKRRTLTNLYNARPQWLADAHAALDATVAAAYGWDAEISEDNALAQLLALNQQAASSSPTS